MKELDIVKAATNINDVILKGTKGTVVYIYDKENFEVEFFDKEGNTIEVVTCNIKDIDKQ